MNVEFPAGLLYKSAFTLTIVLSELSVYFLAKNDIRVAYFLCCSSLRLPIAGVFPRRACTSECVTVLASGVVVMVTGQEAVTGQQCLRPKPTHAVLTAGEQNITHCTSVRREEGKGRGK